MNITVKEKMIKSRNPTEYKIRLETQTGELIQVLGDDYNLIRFAQFRIKNKPLEWYLHDFDFYIKNKM